MKKIYVAPTAERLTFDYTNNVVASCTEKPGHGYGDVNHTHKHWHDRNDK